jgi:sugar phosphate permease
MPSLISPKESVGTVGGIMNTSNQIAGIVAPIATGYIVAATKSYSWAFIAAAAVLVMGISAYVFLLGDMAPIAEPAE